MNVKETFIRFRNGLFGNFAEIFTSLWIITQCNYSYIIPRHSLQLFPFDRSFVFAQFYSIFESTSRAEVFCKLLSLQVFGKMKCICGAF